MIVTLWENALVNASQPLTVRKLNNDKMQKASNNLNFGEGTATTAAHIKEADLNKDGNI